MPRSASSLLWPPRPLPPPCVRPPAGADVLAYLVNVHVRPGYNFPNADAANELCPGQILAAAQSAAGYTE